MLDSPSTEIEMIDTVIIIGANVHFSQCKCVAVLSLTVPHQSRKEPAGGGRRGAPSVTPSWLREWGGRGGTLPRYAALQGSTGRPESTPPPPPAPIGVCFITWMTLPIQTRDSITLLQASSRCSLPGSLRLNLLRDTACGTANESSCP